MLADTILSRTPLNEDGRMFQLTLNAAQKFGVTNVARYVEGLEIIEKAPGGSAQPRLYVDFVKDIPNGAPLAPYMWFEWSGAFQYAECNAAGVLLASLERSEAPEVFNRSHVPAATRWIYKPMFVFHYADNTIGTRIDYPSELGVAADGRMLYRVIGDTEGGAGSEGFAVGPTAVAMYAIAFAHCKNVCIEAQTTSEKLQKARARKGKPPLVTWHTLTIQGGLKAAHQPRQTSTEQSAKTGVPLHIVRGHFAHYTPEHPLFGRPTEKSYTLWRPMHTRGSEQFGTRGKDYTIKPPTNNSTLYNNSVE